MSDEYVVELMRIGPLFKKKHVRGFLTVKKNGIQLKQFSTLERGLNFTNMKVGSYEMIHSWKRTNSIVQCLRPTNRWISTVLIHEAFNNDAMNLEGCIAPFMVGTELSYERSGEAIQEMFKALGGFDDLTPKKVTLMVLNNYPNEKRTAEQWIAGREKLAKEKAKKAAAARRALLPNG